MSIYDRMCVLFLHYFPLYELPNRFGKHLPFLKFLPISVGITDWLDRNKD